MVTQGRCKAKITKGEKRAHKSVLAESFDLGSGEVSLTGREKTHSRTLRPESGET